MDANLRKKLNEMLKDNDDAVDNTQVIRDQKHSVSIKADLEKYMRFDYEHRELRATNHAAYMTQLQEKCDFIHKHYPEILQKLATGNLDMKIMFTMLNVFREIEDGKLDQHEASFKIGSLLKELYVDTVINDGATKTPAKDVSYSEWKNGN